MSDNAGFLVPRSNHATTDGERCFALHYRNRFISGLLGSGAGRSHILIDPTSPRPRPTLPCPCPSRSSARHNKPQKLLAWICFAHCFVQHALRPACCCSVHAEDDLVWDLSRVSISRKCRSNVGTGIRDVSRWERAPATKKAINHTGSWMWLAVTVRIKKKDNCIQMAREEQQNSSNSRSNTKYALIRVYACTQKLGRPQFDAIAKNYFQWRGEHFGQCVESLTILFCYLQGAKCGDLIRGYRSGS